MLLFWYEEKDNWKRKIVAILVFILFFTKGNVAIVKFLFFVNSIALPFYIYHRKYMLRIWVWFSLLLLQQWILSSHHSSLRKLQKCHMNEKWKNLKLWHKHLYQVWNLKWFFGGKIYKYFHLNLCYIVKFILIRINVKNDW